MTELYIGLDVDNTILTHCYPGIGGRDLGAVPWLVQAQQKYPVRYLLNTMRSGSSATIVLPWLRERGVPIAGVNKHPDQHQWTASPKCYCHLYVDDRAVGVPLLNDGGINWEVFGPVFLQTVGRMCGDPDA